MDKTWKTNVPAQKLLNVRFSTGEYKNDSKPKVIIEKGKVILFYKGVDYVCTIGPYGLTVRSNTPLSTL